MAEPIPDGEHLLPTSRLWPDERQGPWLLTFHWQVIAGRAECVGLDVASALPESLLKERFSDFATLPDIGQPVTTSVLRSLKLAELVAEERERADHLFTFRLGDRELGAAYSRPGQMRAATEKRLHRVADVYREAWQKGQPPVKAVAKRMKVTDVAAAKLVARARAAGFLPPASPGVPVG